MTIKIQAAARLTAAALPTTYEEALALKEAISKDSDAKGAHFTKLCDAHKGGMGLTSDEFKKTPEYKKAKAEFDAAFAKERAINTWFLKNKEFKKRYQADRHLRLARGRS